MDVIKSMAAVFCAGAIAAGIASMLLPSGKMEKVMRMLLGFFLVAVTLSPFMGKDKIRWEMPAFAAATEENAVLAGTVAEQQKEAAAGIIRTRIEQHLKGLDIFNAEVALDMDIDEENRISIMQTKVFLPAGCPKSTTEVRESLESTLGIEAEVF